MPGHVASQPPPSQHAVRCASGARANRVSQRCRPPWRRRCASARLFGPRRARSPRSLRCRAPRRSCRPHAATQRSAAQPALRLRRRRACDPASRSSPHRAAPPARAPPACAARPARSRWRSWRRTSRWSYPASARCSRTRERRCWQRRVRCSSSKRATIWHKRVSSIGCAPLPSRCLDAAAMRPAARRGGKPPRQCAAATLSTALTAPLQTLTRKLVHIISGTGFLMTWLLFRCAAQRNRHTCTACPEASTLRLTADLPRTQRLERSALHRRVRAAG